MSVINTNVKALFAQSALKTNDRSLTAAMEQLSTGKRINSAKDDAAGLAIATRMTQQIRSLDQAVRNAGDAITLIQTAEGATNEITNMLQRMRELAIQAINDTNANEQRSYLDLEFQQLKKEIVRVADTTEWNGFSILNGTAGERVGERPVYKATSVDDFDTVFIQPTTTRIMGGRDAGVVEDMDFDGASADPADNPTMQLTLPDNTAIDVALVDTDGDNTIEDTEIASAVAYALRNDSNFDSASGRTVAVIDGTKVRISYDTTETADLDVSDTIAISQTDVTSAPTGSTRYDAIDVSASTAEAFSLNGGYLQSGSLSFNIPETAVDGDTVSATFLNTRGEEITLTGTLNLDHASDGKTRVVFEASGTNAKVISKDLTYTLKKPDGTDAVFDGRRYSVSVDVEGSIPPLRSGDLLINGIGIGPSSADDDTKSPANNAAGSAIAIAAAINRKTSLTGVAAVVNANVMAGAAMTPGAVASGYIVVNGYSSPLVTSTLNDTRTSREDVVKAINFISKQTGVTAVDTGSDTEGIRLLANDGRNIEVQFKDLSTTASNFSAATGIRAGVQSGSYSLESKVEDAIRVTTTAKGDVERARLAVADYDRNISTFTTGQRAVVTDADDIKVLSAGNLTLNGVAIPASRSSDDRVSDTTSATSEKAGSAIAIAAAINSVSAQTGVTAEIYGAKVEGTTATRAVTSGSHTLYVNGIGVDVDFTVGTTAGERVDEVMRQINFQTGAHGVLARKTDLGGLALETVDGRNLSVWFDTSGSVTASEFGLGSTVPASAVTGIANATSSSTGAATVYGRVTLVSAKPMAVEPGVSGYGSESNFSVLGFQAGQYGGVVDEATSKMTPPRVGRLTFQVGASANQSITIDLSDFGKKGPITGNITGDVDDETPTVNISSVDDANKVLDLLDEAMDKVNATRATMGAVMNRLEHTIDNLTNVSTNTSASRSQIEDADYAKASSDLARAQIIQQAATAVLAQANTSQQSVLKLLQG